MLDVKVEFPRGYDPASELGKHRLKRWRPVRGIAVSLAREIRNRVTKRGDTVQRHPGYSKKSSKLVASRYPLVAQPDVVRADGTLWWESSDKFHKAAMGVQGSYEVSGGMWQGLAVSLSGKQRARVAVRGRSQGQSPSTGVSKVTGKRSYKPAGKRSYKPAGIKVSNAEKAGTVLESKGVNIIQNNVAEQHAMADAVNIESARTVAPSFGVDVMKTRGRRGNARLVREMVKAIRTGVAQP
jgi:hypothetical protein